MYIGISAIRSPFVTFYFYFKSSVDTKTNSTARNEELQWSMMYTDERAAHGARRMAEDGEGAKVDLSSFIFLFSRPCVTCVCSLFETPYLLPVRECRPSTVGHHFSLPSKKCSMLMVDAKINNDKQWKCVRLLATLCLNHIDFLKKQIDAKFIRST